MQLAHCMAPTTAAGAGREQEENRLQSELSSLGVDCKRKNELNGKEELEAHATAIKSIFKTTRLPMMIMISTKKLTNHTLAISFR